MGGGASQGSCLGTLDATQAFGYEPPKKSVPLGVGVGVGRGFGCTTRASPTQRDMNRRARGACGVGSGDRIMKRRRGAVRSDWPLSPL